MKIDGIDLDIISKNIQSGECIAGIYNGYIICEFDGLHLSKSDVNKINKIKSPNIHFNSEQPVAWVGLFLKDVIETDGFMVALPYIPNQDFIDSFIEDSSDFKPISLMPVEKIQLISFIQDIQN